MRWKTPADPRLKPRRFWYGVAALIFILGVLGGAALLVMTIVAAGPSGPQFLAPSLFYFDAAEAGRYQIWNHTETDFQGRHYSSPYLPPENIQIQVLDPVSGKRLPVTPSLGLKEKAGPVTRYAIASFVVPARGRVDVLVNGAFGERVFSIQRSRAELLLTAVIGGVLMCAVGGIAAPIMAFVVYVRRGRSRRTLYGPEY
jgi:hypothetical protein